MTSTAGLGPADLVRFFALGRIEWLPVSLFVVSTLGLGAYGALTGRLASIDRRAWWLLLNPAVLIGYVGDSTEPLGLALLIAVAVASNPVLVGAGAALVGGVRPSVVPATLVGRRPWQAAIAGGAVAAGLLVLGRVVFPDDPPFPFRPPFVGYAEAAASTPLPDLVIAGIVAGAATVTLAIGVLRRSGAARWGWVLGALVVLTLPVRSIDAATNLLRVAGFLPVIWAVDARCAGGIPEP